MLLKINWVKRNQFWKKSAQEKLSQGSQADSLKNRADSSTVHRHYFGLAHSRAGSRWIQAHFLNMIEMIFLDSIDRASSKLEPNQFSQVDRKKSSKGCKSSQFEDRFESALSEKLNVDLSKIQFEPTRR